MSGTSGVVLRCPNCGTTQATAGECDACHEGTVRHYCTNHTPGRWLDGGVCPECALRPARVAPVERAPRVPSPAPSRPPLVPRPPVSRGPVPRVPGPTVERPRSHGDDMPPPVAETGRDPTAISLEELLATIRAMRSGSRRDRDVRERAEWEDGGPSLPLPDAARGRGMPAAVGCLKRLLILVLIAAVLFAIASAWFFGSVIVGDAGGPGDPAAATVRMLASALGGIAEGLSALA